MIPWQELGGVRYDKQPHKMEERLCVNLRGHTHDAPTLEHEQVLIPTAPKPKVETSVPSQQFMNYQNQPPHPMTPGSKPRGMMPMQAPHFTGIMGAPAPNVTITQQGPVPTFNPHEVQGQFPFDGNSSKPHYAPAAVSGPQQMFDSSNTNYIETQGGIVRGQYGGPPAQNMMRPQFMSEQQKRKFLESQQQKVRIQGHPRMYQQPAQQPTAAQAPPPYIQQHISNPGLNNPGIGNPMETSYTNPQQMMSQAPHQFIHRPVLGAPAPMSNQPTMAPLSSTGNVMIQQPSDSGFGQTSFFDQQFN